MAANNFLKHYIFSFSSGKLDKSIDDNPLLEKRTRGCLQAENVRIYPDGRAVRRPGMRFIAEQKYTNKHSVLIGSQLSENTSHILEVGERYIRFFTNRQQVLVDTPTDPVGDWTTETDYSVGSYCKIIEDETTTNYLCRTAHTSSSGFFGDDTGNWIKEGDPYEIDSPFGEGDLNDIYNELSLNDVIYLMHPQMGVYKLSRYGDNDWRIELVDFEPPAFKIQNLDESITITPSATSGVIELVASDDVFKENHVGSIWQISHIGKKEELVWPIETGSSASSSISGKGVCNVITSGTWDGTLTVEKSSDGTSWYPWKIFVSEGGENFSESDELDVPYYFRFKGAGITITQTPEATFSFLSQKYDGTAKITGFTDSKNVGADVIDTLKSTDATYFWAEPAWSKVSGFPQCGAVHDQRLCLSGVSSDRQALFMSVSRDLENFEYGEESDKAQNIKFGTASQTTAHWMVSKSGLVIGTDGNIYAVVSTNGDVLTVKNARPSVLSSRGVARIKPVVLNDKIVYVTKTTRDIEQLRLSEESNTELFHEFKSPSKYAKEILSSGIKKMAYSQERDDVLYVLLNNGNMGVLTTLEEEGVSAWTEYKTNGIIRSFDCISDEGKSEVWVSVERTIGGVKKKFIECFVEEFSYDNEDVTYNEKTAVYLDCAATYNNPQVSELYAHWLAGEEIELIINGLYAGKQVVGADGKIITGLPNDSKHMDVVAGLSYESIVEPMSLYYTFDGGMNVYTKKKIMSVALKLVKTYAPSVVVGDGERFTNLRYQEKGVPLANLMSYPKLLSDMCDVPFTGGISDKGRVVVKQTAGMPFCLSSIYINFELKK